MKFGESGQDDEVISKISMATLDFSFSPSGKYMATFSKPPMPNLTTSEPAMIENNLRIWKLNCLHAKELISFHHRHQNSWHIQWTEDETYFSRQVLPNEVHFYRTEDTSKIAFKIREDNLTTFALSPGSYPKVSIFIKETKGEPAAIKIFLLPNTSTPVASKYFFKADKIQFEWSPNGKNLLAVSHTDVDTTGQSYYGENNLYFISGDGSFDSRVDLDKSGPVHDITWGPKSDEFIVCYGYMPSKITLFNLKCEPAFEFPVESKNHVRYSPAGNLICFGGFGNLPGHVEIWTRSGTTLKKISFLKAPGSSICEWSPSGHALVTGTVTPRLRVDNGLVIWSWTGEQLEKTSMSELYQVAWNPCGPLAKFPLVDFSKSSKIFQSPALQSNVEVKREAYRPPGLRERSLPLPDDVKSAKEVKPIVAVQKATISSGLSNREKNIRKLERKLEQIRELKAKLADGIQLELNQLDKIKSEKEVEQELQIIMTNPEI
jgi:translation initiation factor 2A